MSAGGRLPADFPDLVADAIDDGETEICLHRADMFAAIDNTVVLPGYVRVDAAAYFVVDNQARLQLNIENLTDQTYYLNADGNTNISPGYPRAVRVALITRF